MRTLPGAGVSFVPNAARRPANGLSPIARVKLRESIDATGESAKTSALTGSNAEASKFLAKRPRRRRPPRLFRAAPVRHLRQTVQQSRMGSTRGLFSATRWHLCVPRRAHATHRCRNMLYIDYLCLSRSLIRPQALVPLQGTDCPRIIFAI